MNNTTVYITTQACIIVLIFMLLAGTPCLMEAGGIPVYDVLGLEQFLDHLEAILEKYSQEIGYYKDILTIKDQYIREMREIIYRSESLSRALIDFPRTVTSQFTLNPYFYDLLKKDTWGELYKKDGNIEDQYPGLGDFDWIKDSYLYKHSPEFREYTDRVLQHKEEEKIEMEREFGLMKYMKEFQEERARFLDQFEKVIVPGYSSADDEAEEDKVVDLSKLYYAIGMAKLEIVKQNLEMLIMEKELMENYIKSEVNTLRNWMLGEKYKGYGLGIDSGNVTIPAALNKEK